MSFDNSRYTFNPFKSYSSVVLPQGRVQLDADWNEFLAEIARRIQAGTLDTMGRAVYPVSTPNAFYISGSSTPYVVNIGQGRFYIDGLLAENHGPAPGTWDPALAELSGAPQPAPTSITGTPNIPFTSQPYFPGATAPGAGTYLFYLDVWTREVTWLEDPSIIDTAVGIDTSGRLQTIWQVRWMPAGSANLASPGTDVTCGTPDTGINWPTASAGLLTNGVVPNTTTGNCCLTPGTGYTGLENQFYRVQIHQGGPVGKATFKWSRENASVATSVNNIATKANPGGTQVTVLAVASLGRDQVLNFNNGDWIELLDDDIEWNGQPDPAYPSGSAYIYGNPGILCQIGSVDPTTNSIFLTTQLSSPPVASASLHTRIQRWDQSGVINSTDSKGNLTPQPGLSLSTGDIEVPAAGTVLELENGLTVSFSTAAGGNFLSGDFWCFSARTDGSYDQITTAFPLGAHHHYTKLSVVTFDGAGKATNTPDCRLPWPTSMEGDCGCCTATVGDNQTTFGAYTSIQQAIDNLPPTGGTVCILPGQYYESIIIDGLTQVTLQGSGPLTTLYAFSANPGGTSDESGSSATIATNSGLNAIITITNSQHIKLTGFTVEAPDGMTCILLDEISAAAEVNVEQAKAKNQVQKKAAKNAAAPAPQVEQVNPAAEYKNIGAYKYIPRYNVGIGNGSGFDNPIFLPSGTDVTLTNLVLAASTAPAIAALQASLLNITENRILMKDVASLWPAIYVSGAEITIQRNRIGLQDNSDAANFATAQLISDLTTNFNVATAAPVANGGIQIGGYSTGVFIIDNDLESGAFNAITLGAILRLSGTNQIAGLNGLFLAPPAATAGSTLVLPAADPNGNTLAADGPLQSIRIERNRIGNFGLCAIGPVGYFNSAMPEIISVANLVILGNTISGSLQATLQPFPQSMTGLGYGAICLPDLQFVLILDNVITDFGSLPGAQVCGIFILNGEQVEISRNQILETRDWATIGTAPSAISGLQAGIGIPMVSSPALSQSATAAAWTGSSSQGVATAGSPPLYQPGLPALRIDQNVVRLPLGGALDVLGYGPFSITGNHFATGGTVPAPASTTTTALTVTIVNLGAEIELDTPTTFTGLWGTASNPTPPSMQVVDNSLSNSTSGMILFANNQCQLETRASGATGFASLAIVTKDNLIYANNLTWMDGVGTVPIPGTPFSITALMDVFLLGASINVSNNRFQEGPNSVLFSGMTAALANITTGNISTFCLFSQPNAAPWGANANNVSFEAALTTYRDIGNACDVLSSTLLGGFGLSPGYKAATPAEGEVNYPFSYRDTATTSDPVEKLNAGVGNFDTVSTSRVQQLSLTHQARIAQYTRIASVVTAQSGSTSPQAVAANAVVAASQTTVARIAMIKRQVSASAPAVAAAGWALYGAVYNSSNAPVSAYSLYFVDATNTYQNTFGIAYTAADGSFQLVYAGPPAGQTAPTTPLFVQVCNASGDPVYTSPTAFSPTVGAATYQVITLPAGEKPIGKLPIVFRDVAIPTLNKEIVPNANISINNPETETNKG
ncbi:MAG: DUF6519 domain-containing protein [Terracidiphilus sp.]